MEEDWELQAIVRGCSSTHGHNSLFDYQDHSDDSLYKFPDESNEVDHYNSFIVNELDDFYEPFYTLSDHHPSNSLLGDQKLEQEEEEQLQTLVIATPKAAVTHSPKKYKRKNRQLTRVVVKVKAEALSSDKWAWRKYGQKPIKGSPYPRSYYRCSSSKACLARKQVEQSCSDQGMYILTYTAEHNHNHPTRRSSLAGT